MDQRLAEAGAPGARPPLEPEPPALRPYRRAAGGLDAILATARHTLEAMGPLRGLRVLLDVNQEQGFDCPGCAWPDPLGHRSVAEFCENGAKAVAEEATTRKAGPDFFREWSVDALREKSDHWLGHQGRLTHPMALRKGSRHYEPVSWEYAFSLLAGELKSLTSPDEAVFYTSGRTSNEAAFLYQLFARHFGTNNLPDCSNMCHESSGAGLSQVIGIGKGTVTLEDFDLADTILVIGQNPGTNHPRMLTSLLRAARRGATIVSVNPLREAGLVRFTHPQEVLGLLGRGTPLASHFLQVRVNGDIPLLKGLAREILEEEERRPGEVLDHAFIEAHTTGFPEYAAALRAVSWESIVEQSGVPREQIREVAEILIRSRRTIACWAMGLTQHRNAVGNVQEVVNLLMLQGNLGRPGAGVCPVRGHSNVQGDRTVGIVSRPRPELLEALGREFGFRPPTRPGFDTVEAIRAMDRGQVRVFLALGGNFLSATPDTDRTARALSRCRLTAHVSTKLNRSHLVHGEQALILPCLGRTEADAQASGPQFVTVENSMGIVHASRGKLPPASEHLLSEPALVGRLARAVLGERSSVDWEGLVADYDRIREAIERVIPGFGGYNRRVRESSGFYLPNGPRERRFGTKDGKARFTVHPMPRPELAPGQLLMMTLRSHDQYNTTIYGLDDRYRGIYGGRRVVLLHPADMEERGIAPQEAVDLVSHFAGEERVAEAFRAVPYDIPRGCAATYFPEANALVPLDHVAEVSNTPASKSVVISLRKRDVSRGMGDVSGGEM